MSGFKLKRKIKKGIDIENPIDFLERDEEQENTKGDLKIHKKNRLAVWLFISISISVLFFRTAYLQIVQADYYKDVAENNRIRKVVIKAPRGIIKDVNGEVLARNVASFDVVFVPAYLPEKETDKKSMFQRLFSVLSVDKLEGEGVDFKKLSRNDHNAYLIKSGIDYDSALILTERLGEFPGVHIEKTAKRKYVDGKVFSHIIGYDGKITKEELEEEPEYLLTDNIGKDGIEYTYERFLRGEHGERRFEVDSSNNVKEELGAISPIPGDEVFLNIDAELQRKATKVLEEILEENEDATGAALAAIDPRGGQVRALVSLPSYDNNLFSGGIEQEEFSKLISDNRYPLLNRVVSGEYPPGSIFKPIVAAIALEEKIITEHTSLNCPGKISIGIWDFPDWKTHGHTDVKKAIAESCDVFFYALGGGWKSISGLGINRIKQYVELFGMGELLGIDLPGEKDGIIPDENWKFKTFGESWYIGDSYHAAIGQGHVTTTPLQMASITATIANGGTFYRPKVVREIVSARTKNVNKNEPELVEEGVISLANMKIVQEGMRQTVTSGSGSGRLLDSLEVETAGKTGTAQFGTEDKLHSWYVSFGPYENPEIAMVVLIEGGGEGNEWAVPATKEIYRWYFDENRGEGWGEEVEGEEENKEEENGGENGDEDTEESIINEE